MRENTFLCYFIVFELEPKDIYFNSLLTYKKNNRDCHPIANHFHSLFDVILILCISTTKIPKEQYDNQQQNSDNPQYWRSFNLAALNRGNFGYQMSTSYFQYL